MITMVFLDVAMGEEHQVEVSRELSSVELVDKIREQNEKYILVDIWY